jgi:hypothetical protein
MLNKKSSKQLKTSLSTNNKKAISSSRKYVGVKKKHNYKPSADFIPSVPHSGIITGNNEIYPLRVKKYIIINPP